MNRLKRMKEILKASPNFGKRVGYKMCVVDELHDIKELEEINADLKQSLDWANEREKELKAQIEKMKCCENCAWWYKLPNGQRDCAETCENRDNWSLRK